MRVLAVDPGERRVGLAISEGIGSLALPLDTLERRGEGTEATAARIAAVAAREQVGHIVVGLPLRLDGREGLAARRARALGEAIARHARLPVEYWDERLTTVQAEADLRRIGVRGARRRAVVDQAAATVLLRSWLAARSGTR